MVSPLMPHNSTEEVRVEEEEEWATWALEVTNSCEVILFMQDTNHQSLIVSLFAHRNGWNGLWQHGRPYGWRRYV